MKISAETRTSVHKNHALIAPDGRVSSTIPGWTNCQSYTIINERMGARFNQLLLFLDEEGTGEGNTDIWEYFIYIMDGEGTVYIEDHSQDVASGDFVFIPPATNYRIINVKQLKLTVFQKQYVALEGYSAPTAIIGQAANIASNDFLDDPQLKLQTLLPEDLSFDMAVNIFTYEPGGHLPFVETHVMEHGLIYLQGQGIYRLGNHWYPVTADDCIWMAPYCPQWFVAMGKEPAVYLYYKDVNRFA